jgi:hypothetical protein
VCEQYLKPNIIHGNKIVKFDRYGTYYNYEGENDINIARHIITRRVGTNNSILNVDFGRISFAIGNGFCVDYLEICNNITNSVITFGSTFKNIAL